MQNNNNGSCLTSDDGTRGSTICSRLAVFINHLTERDSIVPFSLIWGSGSVGADLALMISDCLFNPKRSREVTVSDDADILKITTSIAVRIDNSFELRANVLLIIVNVMCDGSGDGLRSYAHIIFDHNPFDDENNKRKFLDDFALFYLLHEQQEFNI